MRDASGLLLKRQLMFNEKLTLRIKTLGTALMFLTFSGIFSSANAQVFRFENDTVFDIGNSGASHYLFNWDAGTDEIDPTLELIAGNTYSFQRTSGAHPFVITDDTLPVSGTDGSYSRTTTDGAVIDDATLKPLADFTADPGPTSDLILWTPTEADLGQYYYTCRVTGHTGMTGSIRVLSAVPEPSSIALILGLAGVCAVRRKRNA